MISNGNDLASVHISLPIENAMSFAIQQSDSHPMVAIIGDTLTLCVVPLRPPYAAFLLPFN